MHGAESKTAAADAAKCGMGRARLFSESRADRRRQAKELLGWITSSRPNHTMLPKHFPRRAFSLAEHFLLILHCYAGTASGSTWTASRGPSGWSYTDFAVRSVVAPRPNLSGTTWQDTAKPSESPSSISCAPSVTRRKPRLRAGAWTQISFLRASTRGRGVNTCSRPGRRSWCTAFGHSRRAWPASRSLTW
jgi:hypothetical protein